MGFRFQRRIKLFPGFYLNFSKSGVSSSAKLGPVTLNSRGTTTIGAHGTGLSYRFNHEKNQQQFQQPVESETIGYSSDEVNDMVLELRHQIIDKVYYGLWDQDVVGKAIAEENVPASLSAQAKLLIDLETIEEYCRNGTTVEECSGRIQEILKAITAVITYGTEMGWCDSEPA